MPSPFPGMDPFLEPHWPDVHGALIQLSKSELNRQLPEDLVARSEERVTIGGGDGPARRLAPDVRVFESVADRPHPTVGNGHATNGVGVDDGGGGAGLMLAPFRLELFGDEVVERFLEIRDARDGGRLVTVVEFLSPSNKIGDGRAEFARKRADLLEGGANVVEVDLVRAGNWEELLRPFIAPSGVDAAYRTVMIVPAGDRRRWPTAFFHPMPLREPLPTIQIPLRPEDAPAVLSLQPLVDAAYANGRYGRTLRHHYGEPLDPPLAPDDAAWAEGRVAEGRASL